MCGVNSDFNVCNVYISYYISVMSISDCNVYISYSLDCHGEMCDRTSGKPNLILINSDMYIAIDTMKISLHML